RDEALKIARKHRVAIDHGRDPLAEKEAARLAGQEGLTLAQLFALYVQQYAMVRKRPRSIATDRWMFEREIQDVLGRRRVADITEFDLARLHRAITARPAPVLANRVLALISTLLNLSELPLYGQLRPRHSNPCKGIERNRETKKHRFLSSAQLIA